MGGRQIKFWIGRFHAQEEAVARHPGELIYVEYRMIRLR
jgi:hypothetical protein